MCTSMIVHFTHTKRYTQRACTRVYTHTHTHTHSLEEDWVPIFMSTQTHNLTQFTHTELDTQGQTLGREGGELVSCTAHKNHIITHSTQQSQYHIFNQVFSNFVQIR